MPAKSSPPSQLAELQTLMARAVMRPLTSSEEMQRTWSDGSPTREVVGSFIKPNDRLTSFDRLQIYNQQYWWRIQSTFAEDFRGLRAVIGERRFSKVSVAYLDHCGSQSWTLRNLGSRLESFLREHPDLTAPHTELALDMVQVEWARVVAFDDPDRTPVKPAKLAKVMPSELRLDLQPYLTLLELHHPIDELLRKLKKRASIETASASNAVSSERPRARRRLSALRSDDAIYLAVHRVDLNVYFKRLEPAAWRILTALRDGATLETACGEAFLMTEDAPEDPAAKLQKWFEEWMGFGWFTLPLARAKSK